MVRVTHSWTRKFARGTTFAVATAVVIAVPGLSFAGGAQAATPRVPLRPSAAHERLCSPVHVELANLPAKSTDPLILYGPGRQSRPFPASGSLCLTEPGIYHVVARPVLFKNRLGRWWHAFPTTVSGVQHNEVFTVDVTSPPSMLPRLLSVNYYDQAPLTTVVLARPDLVLPQGRLLPAFGALSIRRSGVVGSLRPGDIVVAPVSPGLPHGLLGSVTSSRSVGTTYQVVTSKVSPFRAFSRGHLVLSVARSSAVSDSLATLGGEASLARSHQDLGVGCGNNFTVSGSASFQPSASLSLGWSWGPWYAPWQANISGSFSLNPGVSSQLTVSATSGIHCQISEDLATVPIATVCTEFGCFTFNLVATASLGGSVGVAFSQTLSESLTGGVGASFGFGYNGSNFQGTNTLSLVGTSSASTAWSGSVGFGIGPTLQVLYGIPDVAGVGPEVGVQDTATLNSTTTGWTANGGVSALVGVAMSALGFSYSDSTSIPIVGVTLDSGSWPTQPSPPLSVVASPDAATPQTSVDVSWQPPVWPGACGLSGYTVAAGTASVNVGANATSATLTGLSADTTYTVTVTATTTGCGSSQATANVTTAPLAPPGPPSITTVVSPGGGGRPAGSITFEPPAPCPTCAAVSGYVITWSGDGTSGTTAAPGSPDVFPLPAFGTPYVVTVAATSSAGPGVASRPFTFTPRGLPSAPLDVTVTSGPLSSGGHTRPAATLSWQPPASDGGEALTRYWITWSDGVVNQAASAGTSAVINLPAWGTPYNFCVQAINSLGLGPTSPCVSTTAFTLPDAPSALTASPPSNGNTNVTWSPPTFDGGTPVTAYEVDWAGPGTWGEQTASGTSATVSLPGTGVYELTVFATTLAGESPASPAVCVTSGTTVPCAPTIASTTSGIYARPATVTWTAPINTGNEPIISYTLTWTGPASGSMTHAATVGTSVSIPGLPVGRYLVVVRATNAQGTSLPSAPGSFQMLTKKNPPPKL